MKEEQTINGLPKDWKIVDVNSIGRIETGSTPSKQNANYYADDFPFYKPTDLEAGYNVRIAKDHLSEAGIKQARFLPENSILVTCIGATIGKTGLIRKAGASNQQINAIIPSDNVHPSFVYYQVIGPEFQKKIKDNASATTLPILNKTKFQNLPFVFARFSDQQQIVFKIEELFSELDKGIEELKTAQQQLKVYRQAVLKWAFEGKLTNENVKDGELLEGWEKAELNNVAKVVSGYAFKSTDFKSQGIPVIKISNIGYSEFVWKDQEFLSESYLQQHKNFAIHGEDLLIALTRPITNNTTKVCKYPKTATVGLLNQRVASIKEINGDKEYLFWYFQTDSFKSYIRSKFSETLQPNLSPKDLAQTPIPFCSIEEQQQIVQEIESRLSVCDKIEETITASLKQAEALRQSILKKAFEGKLLN